MEHSITPVTGTASQQMGTLSSVPQHAPSDTKGKLPTAYSLFPVLLDPSCDPGLLRHTLHCRSWCCLLTPVLYIPLGQTALLPGPLSGSTPQSSLPRPLLSHVENASSLPQLQPNPLWDASFLASAWKPQTTLFSSCCPAARHTLLWGASTLVRDGKLFRVKESIKITFIGTPQLSCFVLQKKNLMHQEEHNITYT